MKYQSNRCSLQSHWVSLTLALKFKASSLLRSSRGQQRGGNGSESKGLRRKRLPIDERKSLCSPTGLAKQLRSHRHNSNHDNKNLIVKSTHLASTHPYQLCAQLCAQTVWSLCAQTVVPIMIERIPDALKCWITRCEQLDSTVRDVYQDLG